MKIDIRYENFNSEYQADITLAHNKIDYISAGNLSSLLDEIKRIIINYNNQCPQQN